MSSAKNNPLFDRKAPTGKSKRPDHQDFWTTEECKQKKLTGIRQNNIAMQWEFWILGRVERTVSFAVVKKDPLALTRAHVDLFAMVPDPKLFQR